MIEPGQNTGFIAVEPSSTDWIHGGETGVIGAAINPAADWRSFESSGERQLDLATGFETDACVSFSANDMLQTYGNYCIAKGLWTAELVAWLQAEGYLGTDGHLHFSDRFTAKMSGTTMQFGNSLPAVMECIRTNGLVPESMWPNNFAALTPGGDTQANWNTYYAPIPADVIAKGKEFLSKFALQYEWVAYTGVAMTPAAFAQQLAFSPIQIATAVCSPWNVATPIQGCGAGSQHATLLTDVEAGVSFHILDHYVPFDKQFALNYTIPYAMRGILIPAAAVPPAPAPAPVVFNDNLALGAPANTKVHQLQIALQTLKSPKTGAPYMKAGVFGPFGPQTEVALGAFQVDHGIADAPQGHDFGPQTRAAMNAALAALTK